MARKQKPPVDWHAIAEHQGVLGATGWMVADVHQLREDQEWSVWSDDDALIWLQRYDKYMLGAMTSAGWSAMESLMDDGPLNEELP